MATDYKSILSSLQSGTGLGTTSAAGTTTPTTTTSPSSSTTPTTTAGAAQGYLDRYNASREQGIRDMYASNLERNRQQLQTAYDQNLSDAEAAREKIAPQYQESRNEIAAEYERQRRNNNMQAAANGINTGANSQMQLAQSSQYQTTQAENRQRENEALIEADRGIVDLKTNYQNQIAQATANNDYQLAAALLDEYGAQYERQMTQASQLAEFGDFSLYASIYGDAAAQNMERTWAMQNPQIAYNLGKITADEYFNLTGQYPAGYAGGLGALLGGGFGGFGGGSGYVGGGDTGTPTGSGILYDITPAYDDQEDRKDSYSPYISYKTNPVTGKPQAVKSASAIRQGLL